MKALIIVIVLAVAGYFGYQQFFSNDIASQIASELHSKAPMLDESVIEDCAEDALSGLSSADKEIISNALAKKDSAFNGSDGMQNMQVGMTFFAEVMECINN